ncbi:hypothetical protein [Anatilimnocola floriformis]|uniref:hypothetical protein n=1 Tax=Anatilimnocola floriformis TaxID=2948575 RepID=UPI0020C24CAB|nr:hypothetical protein [Anatilimnocola floriformis]
MQFRFFGVFVALVMAAAFVGCGNSQGTVSGSVTISGQPLAKGQIQFTPPTGGTPVGAAIVAGKYTAVNVVPGDKQVLITEEVEQAVALTHEEMQKQMASGARPAPPLKSRISPTTKGNGKTVTIKVGSQTQDFLLEP